MKKPRSGRLALLAVAIPAVLIAAAVTLGGHGPGPAPARLDVLRNSGQAAAVHHHDPHGSRCPRPVPNVCP